MVYVATDMEGSLPSRSSRILVYALIVVVFFGELLDAVPRADWHDKEPAQLDMTVSQLDSFSPPGIAKVVLQQEAERLLQAYSSQRRWRSQWGEVCKTVPDHHDVSYALLNTNSKKTASDIGCQSAINDMEELHSEIQSLEVDLDRKLMIMCFDEHLWNQFVNRYLDFLQCAPENSFIVTWAANALDAAGACGRSQELSDAIEHVVQFRGRSKAGARLKGVLAVWRAEDGRASSAGDD